MRILRDDGLLNKPRICFLVHCAGRRLLLLPRTGLPCHAFSTAVRLKSLKTMSRDELLLHQIVSVGNLGPSNWDNNVFWKFIIKWTWKSPQISVRLLVLPEQDVNYTKDPKCLVFKSFLPAKYEKILQEGKHRPEIQISRKARGTGEITDEAISPAKTGCVLRNRSLRS